MCCADWDLHPVLPWLSPSNPLLLCISGARALSCSCTLSPQVAESIRSILIMVDMPRIMLDMPLWFVGSMSAAEVR